MALTARAPGRRRVRSPLAPLALIVLIASQAGCAALRNEWSDKHGRPDIDGQVRAAVQRAAPEATEVSVSSQKNGFEQEMNVDVTHPAASFDADALLTLARAICTAADLTDVVLLEVADGSAAGHLELAGLVTEQFPTLDTPYDPTEVRIEIDEDCPGL